ncbi:putative membrane protein required for colicin V production [Cytobacillus horneckiae]|uniref:CvpA family protein n=1 Tax=Cytobacillus horneckiae TaxID=549687 RepID=A0A2N0ZMJ1_9BACI|nr:CvpA family protein [Cytobacillus horneckiae]NRG46350.1 CvpA family protein [Bacillus sp. CRN 9]MBN6887936.1 CvpA family protein [Cytobacillus horneckiae]MCM3179652.1 CvpA family protein [Cytobacillus horneckiae]MEC1155097.1 CvpA family protein [Cytobacillus horneckiae]MED2935997.1 CvpA family protein [Cytobacillus horneckiae]
MLDLAIIIILLFGFFMGLRRGFILQLIHLVGFIIAFVVARLYYDTLAPKLTLWIPYPNFGSDSNLQMLLGSTDLEDAYYRAIAFAIIFFAVKILLQIIGSMLDFVASLPILKQLNTWAGSILGFIEVYLIMFILLYIAALLPITALQNMLNDSFMAEFIIDHTPILSQQIKDLWIDYMAS